MGENDEIELRREARRIADRRRRDRLRCPRCGRAVAETVREAREACLRAGTWHEADDYVIMCPECKAREDAEEERARRVALEDRRAALATAVKEPVPHVLMPI